MAENDGISPLPSGGGRGVRAAGTGHRPNPYIQVALTYLRRPGPWWLAIVLAIALLSVLVSHDPRYDLLVLWVFVLFVWLPGAQHVKEQFADPRAHLVPNFRRVHSTVASAWAVVFAVLLPAALAWHAGYHSVAPVAVSLAVLGGLIWMALLESTRLIPAVFMFWLAFSLNRHEDHLVAFLSGQAEGWAILVLLAGAAATVLGATRLFTLREETYAYRRWRWRDWDETKRTADSGQREWLPWGLRGWLADRHMESLIRHARRASASPCSQLCRWQVGSIAGPSIVPWVLGTTFSVALLELSLPGTSFSVPGLYLLVGLPVCVIVRSLRWRATVTPGVLLPVDRTVYVKQRGLAAALSHLELWGAMSGGLLLAWSTVPGKVLSPVLIANLLVFSGLAQVLVFAVMVWFEPFHLGGASALAGLLIVLAMEIAQFQPSPTGCQFRAWAIMALVAFLGVRLARNAYRRWLVADIDQDFFEVYDVGQ